MQTYFTRPLAKLIEEWQKFPGIGPKSAQRLALHVLTLPNEAVNEFAEAVVLAKEKIRRCICCFNLSEHDLCAVCSDDNRDQLTICVVADAKDVIAIERTRQYKGSYHVLHGLISPLSGTGPDDLTISQLLVRFKKQPPEEIILAIAPTVEGDATVLYINHILKATSVKMTRIAFGLPIGGDLDYADELTVSKSLEGRREV